MKRIFNLRQIFSAAAVLLLAVIFSLSSCKPQISIKASSGNEAVLFFSTGFSESTAKTLKNLTGADLNAPLFNKEDVLALLKASGAVNTSAAIPNSTEISASGTIPELSNNSLSKTGLITKNEKSLTLTIGPKQITTFYSLLNEDAKSYLDLMMIPSLVGEKMTVTEYRELLASMYGPTFADEIVNGSLTITLASPDGKKTLKQTVSLGELLTTDKEKSWSLSF